MKIRSAIGPDQPGLPGNTFVMVDELENKLGRCWIEVYDRAQQMPSRPLEVRLCHEASAQLSESGRRQLLGTAFARAMLLISQYQENARIYAECGANDSSKLELLTSVGLHDDEALISMKRATDGRMKSVPLPKGCALLCDQLRDERERQFFIERQKKLFGREDAEQWLDDVCEYPGMKRMMLICDSGLAAELVCWVQDGCGVIGMVYTAPAWRRKGAASYLMEAARQYFWQYRIMECRISVRSRMKPMMDLAASVGYSREKVLMRLPGVNIDAHKPAAKKEPQKPDIELTDEERKVQEALRSRMKKYRRLVDQQ